MPTPSRTTTSAQRRALLTRLGQWVFTRRFQLPPPATDYRIGRGLRVPMRDGVDLVADHYAPVTSAPAGTLLLRGPYGRDNPPAWITAGLYAARGFHVVLQSARGTFGSGGVFDPGRDEVADGADTVSWLRGQDWFTGRFATVGGSYLGFTQWALLADAPPELEAAAITMGPHDFGKAVWGTGSFALADFLNWSYLMAWQHSGGWIRQLVRSTTTPRRLRPVLHRLPLGDGGTSAARRRFRLVRGLARTVGPDGPLLAAGPAGRGVRPRQGPRPVDRRLAGRLLRPDPRAVPPAAGAWRRRRVDRRPLDTRRGRR